MYIIYYYSLMLRLTGTEEAYASPNITSPLLNRYRTAANQITV